MHCFHRSVSSSRWLLKKKGMFLMYFHSFLKKNSMLNSMSRRIIFTKFQNIRIRRCSIMCVGFHVTVEGHKPAPGCGWTLRRRVSATPRHQSQAALVVFFYQSNTSGSSPKTVRYTGGRGWGVGSQPVQVHPVNLILRVWTGAFWAKSSTLGSFFQSYIQLKEGPDRA